MLEGVWCELQGFCWAAVLVLNVFRVVLNAVLGHAL